MTFGISPQSCVCQIGNYFPFCFLIQKTPFGFIYMRYFGQIWPFGVRSKTSVPSGRSIKSLSLPYFVYICVYLFLGPPLSHLQVPGQQPTQVVARSLARFQAYARTRARSQARAQPVLERRSRSGVHKSAAGLMTGHRPTVVRGLEPRRS